MQPLIVMANKCDVRKISELSEEDQVTEILNHSIMLKKHPKKVGPYDLCIIL